MGDIIPYKERTKKPTLDSKIGKYLIGKRSGLTKKESAIRAGYYNTATNQIEKSKSYQILEKKYYKDEILKEITLQEIAQEQVKNIRQDKDRGAKNKAIEMAISKIEPVQIHPEEDDRVLVILR